MIFSEEHIEEILGGKKTQTRRLNRGIYRVGRSYSVQPGRGKKGIPAIRIVMDEIIEETGGQLILERDALAEGGYKPFEYERIFQKLNPKYNRKKDNRWVFKFHVEGIKKRHTDDYAPFIIGAVVFVMASLIFLNVVVPQIESMFQEENSIKKEGKKIK